MHNKILQWLYRFATRTGPICTHFLSVRQVKELATVETRHSCHRATVNSLLVVFDGEPEPLSVRARRTFFHYLESAPCVTGYNDSSREPRHMLACFGETHRCRRPIPKGRETSFCQSHQ